MADEEPARLILWGSKERRFLIPADAEAPSGYFPVTSMEGRIALVDEEAILPYEVTPEEADAFLEDYLEQAFEPVDAAFEALQGKKDRHGS